MNNLFTTFDFFNLNYFTVTSLYACEFSFRTLIFCGMRHRVDENQAANLLKILSQILYHGCRLSNFYCPDSLNLNQTLLLTDQTDLVGMFRLLNIVNFLPQFYSLLTVFTDPRLATRIAQLLHQAGCPLLVP